MQKKKKVNLAWIIGGIIVITGIGTVAYLAWPKKDSVKHAKQPVNTPNNSVQNLQTQLSQIKQKLNQLTNPTQKSQITSQITDIEKQLKQISQLNNSQQKQTIQQLEQKIKAIKQELGLSDNQKDNPSQDNPQENDNPSPIPPNQETPPPNNEENDCPYFNEATIKLPFEGSAHEKVIADLAEFKKIPRDFVLKCWKKGYHWLDIFQLWEWKIPETDIPDLKTEKRVGVIRELAIMPDIERMYRGETDPNTPDGTLFKGASRNLVVMARKIANGGPKINIDKNIQESDMSKFHADYDENETRNYCKKIINMALSQENNVNSQPYEITLLWSLGIENFQKEEEIGWGKTSGGSAGSTICLALFSSLHQQPISAKVAATGTIKEKEEKVKNLASGQEVILKRGDNLPIGGLKEKVEAAVEKGLNQLVLSKYHSAPNILTKPSRKYPGKNVVSDDYQQVVPAEVQAKLQVHWAENMRELRELVLKNQI